MKIEIDSKELHRIYRQFNTLTNYKSQVRVMSAARSAGAKIVAKQARQKNYGFKDRTGTLRASIIAKKARPFHKGFWYIQAGGQFKKGIAPHAYNVEHGHKGLKDHRGARPHPFLIPASKAAANEAFRKSGLAFWKAVNRELKKGY